MTDDKSEATAARDLGRSPYRVEGGVIVELQQAWLTASLADRDTPVVERRRKGKEYEADTQRRLAELRRREHDDVARRYDELAAGLRRVADEHQAADSAGFARATAAAAQVPGPVQGRQAFDIAARAGEHVLVVAVALRAHDEGWDDVFTEWAGRFGWPQDPASLA